MIPSPLTIFLGLVVLFATALILVAVGVVLLSRGDLGPDDACENPVTGELRPVASDAAVALAFQQAWENAAEQILAGAPEATLMLDESRVSARAAQYLDDRDAPLDDLVVCFHDGYAEARATVEAPGLGDLPLIGGAFETEAEVRGTIDLSGANPRIVIQEFEAGSLPGVLEDEVEDDVERAVNDRLTDLNIVLGYTVTFTEGAATVIVRPSLPATAGQ